MIIHLRDLGVRAVLLDIEGTTTRIAFVHEILFPYARERLTSYLDTHAGTAPVREAVRLLTVEHAADAARHSHPPPIGGAGTGRASDVAAYASWLMDRDRKSPGLKLLQGHIWEEGYRAGDLHGEVFADVPAAIERWSSAGLDVAIYSSGSELAQRLLFAPTPSGDLTTRMAGFFDTSAGAKIEAASYAGIAQRLGRQPAQMLFVSDVTAELNAAREAGMHTAMSLRPGNPPQDVGGHATITTFEQLR